MRVLIVRLSAMGDTVCTLPVAAAIKAQDSANEVVWAVDSRFAPIVEMCPDVDQVAKIDRKAKLGAQFKAIRDLGEFDYALDMQGLLKSGFLVAAAKAKRKLGYHWQREGARLFSSPVRPDPSSIHVVDQYADVARAAGFPCHRAQFHLVPPDESVGSVADKLIGLGMTGPYAVIHPGAGWIAKRWHPSNFAQVADALNSAGIGSILIGSKGEAEAAQEVLALNPSIRSLVNQTNLKELSALIKGARLYVGGDTGATHIAAALGIPCIGVYTATKPSRSCPYGQFSSCPEPTVANVSSMIRSLVANR